MFRNTRNGVWNFHFFMFQFVSKHFETIESVGLDIFSLFQFVSKVLLYNLHVYVSMFRNTRYGVWNFYLFMFQFVSKQLKNGLRHLQPVSVCFRSFTIYYKLCFNVSKHQIWCLEFSPFYVSVCFETFQNN